VDFLFLAFAFFGIGIGGGLPTAMAPATNASNDNAPGLERVGNNFLAPFFVILGKSLLSETDKDARSCVRSKQADSGYGRR
jgi:hypothetical protein